MDINPGGYITQRFERSTGYTVTAVRKGESLTACIDLAELWQQTTAQNELAAVKAQLAAAMAQLNSAKEVKL